MAQVEPDEIAAQRGARRGVRALVLGLGGAVALAALAFFAYESALARIPQHRAALERIVRAQTGLDVRFTELSLRWGWYGPEAVFRQVELDEPGSAAALLRAPELVVGFDAWRTLRSGHPEAGRIELLAPEIDLSSAHPRRAVTVSGHTVLPGSGTSAGGAVSSSAESSVLGRVAVLKGWRGGRIDIEGGTLRLPEHGGNANLLNVQIRRASLRRSDDEWSLAGLVFLPDRVGRSARVVVRVKGDLGAPTTLAGSVHVEAKRLLFPGVREFLAGLPDLARYLPRGGSGDVNVDLSFARGQIAKASGNTHAAGLVFDSLANTGSSLALARLQGDWRAIRLADGWRIQVKSLGVSGFDLAGIQLDGTAHNAHFDWLPGRPVGDRLQTQAKLEEVTLVPRSKDFTLSGLSAQLSGNETQLTIDVQSRAGRLELAQSQQDPLADVHVSAALHVSSGATGWQIATDEFLLEHQRASLRLSGILVDDPREPRVEAHGTLSGADISLVSRILGENSAQAFGAVASQLTAGRIQNAEFALHGPIDKLLSGDGSDGFTGSLTLRNAALSGGDLWPDAGGVGARVEWRGAHIEATLEGGHAGPFQLASAKAQWNADGVGATRLVGHVNGRLEDALAWVREHPGLQEYVPQVQDVDVRGNGSFDFSVLVPSGLDRNSQRPEVLARVSTYVDGVSVQAISGLPALQGVTGSFTFDSGRLLRSTLTGSWLGGPVTLRVGETRGKDVKVQAQGTLNAQQLAAIANGPGTVAGTTDWSGELDYFQDHWRMRVDSNLTGLVSSLPEPFAKRPAGSVPAHLEVQGGGDAALLRASLGDRVRGSFALKRTATSAAWVVERGAVRLGTATPVLPSDALLLIRGHLGQLDLPAYALAWMQLRRDTLPAIRAQVSADEMLIAGRQYGEATLRVERTAAGTDLLLDSTKIAGMARWPTERDPGERQPAEFRLTRLELPDNTQPRDGVGLVAALAPASTLSVDELSWRGRSLGRLSANASVDGDVVVVDNLRLVNGSQDAHGALRCQTAMPACRLSFTLESNDASATLTDFGFRPDVAATAATLKGDLEWRPTVGDAWLASLHGTLGMRLADGGLRSVGRGGDLVQSGPTAAPGQPAGKPMTGQLPSFGLLAVPALVAGLDAREQRDLHFASLEADFEVRDGQASTSNLHFDGDAEILMRGRTGLASRDYDQQVWVLRGEERLPAAVRHFGASPRVAAAWLSLRDLFAGNSSEERSSAVLRLQGSWDDPIVVAEN